MKAKQNISKVLYAFALTLLPGAAIFFAEQVFALVKHEQQIPIAALATYCLSFFFVGLPGIGISSVLKKVRDENFSMIVLLIVGMHLIALTGFMFIYHGKLGGSKHTVDNILIVFSFGLFLSGALRLRYFKKPPLRSAAVIFLLFTMAWAVLDPEMEAYPKPAQYYLLAALLAVSLGLVYRLRPWLRLPRYIEPALLAAAVVLALATESWVAPRMLYSYPENAPSNTEVSASQEDRPNIIFIVMDTVRRDHLSLYGYERETTPFLEEFAKEAVVYNNAITVAPWTLPSHASMFTGMYPRAHGAHATFQGTNDLSGKSFTLAEILSNSGYRCAGFSANYLYAGNFSNMHQGFEYYYDRKNSLFINDTTLSLNLNKAFFNVFFLFFKVSPYFTFTFRNPYMAARDLNEKALEWIDSLQDGESFFLFLNYMEAHDPYISSSELYGHFSGIDHNISSKMIREIRKEKGLSPLRKANSTFTPKEEKHFVSLYDSAILHLDRQIKELTERLENKGLQENTIFIITSDHGEHFGEHDLLLHEDVYSETLDIPLAIKYPDSRSRKIKSITENREIYYILLEQTGSALEMNKYPWDAVSEWYFSKKNETEARRAIYFKEYKFMYREKENKLYDLESDPAESNNLLEKRQLVVDKGEELHEKFLETVPEEKIHGEVDKLSPRERKDLKALGYIK